MDPPAEIPQGADPVPSIACVDDKRLQCFPMVADPVSKVLNDDNLFIEIIIRLGFPTTLVHAALVCKRWLRHASDRAFLRRFRKLHPPRLLGFYLDVRSLSFSYKPTRPCFIPMLPQPTELAAAARRVASYSLDAYHNVWIEDCKNGSIFIRGCRDGTSTFGAGASSSSQLINYGEIICPLGCKGAMTIVPCPPQDPPTDSQFLHTDYTLFKQGGQGLSYLSLFESYLSLLDERINSVARVYMLQDDIWCMNTSHMAPHLCRSRRVRPLLVENKLYIAAFPSEILVLDLKASSFSKIQLPEGVEYGENNTMFSGTDDDFRVYLIHVQEFQLRIWLHNGNNWLLEDAICLREVCANLRMLDATVLIDYIAVVKIYQAGENADSACLQIGQYVLYLDIKCRIAHRVYEMAGNDEDYLDGIYPLMMIWPPTFPALKDDPARQGSSLEIVGSETLNT